MELVPGCQKEYTALDYIFTNISSEQVVAAKSLCGSGTPTLIFFLT